MPNDTDDLAVMIGSRICHDLISPIGAISNGLELMSLGGAAALGPEFELINDSCASATARIRFFRVAFGSSPGAQRMARREITGIMDDIARGSRVSSRWQPPGDLSRDAVQLAFLTYLCLETAMPRGGTVTFDHDSDGWHIRAETAHLAMGNGLWTLFSDPGTPVEVTPSRVEFALLDRLTRAAGQSVRVTQGDGTLTLRI
ncbi:histidine phosphotransferase family protein [Thalassococcus sp. BH17M4-6]|uniref:histidine phosphotransferase family protein n=1 Tax=Thalassococcus sp. BH17M4-6 TaxID=3413148 RepID=UPI003BE6F2B1